MKQLFTSMVSVFFCTALMAQQDTTRPKAAADTIRIGNMIIINKNGSNDNKDGNRSVHIFSKKENSGKASAISTNWFIVDLGFANYNDKTNYANTGEYLVNRSGVPALAKSDFKLNAGKSINVNIWVFMQRFNLIKNYVNLKYGIGVELNNYRYKSAISYLEKNPFNNNLAPAPVIIRDSVSFSKNKLAADYITVPLMLNFRTSNSSKNKGLSLSAGVSAGYLYSQRNKQASKERGKQTNKGDYDLQQFKFSYIGEVGLGPVLLYGSYTPTSIYQRGMNIRPYTLGIRFSNW